MAVGSVKVLKTKSCDLRCGNGDTSDIDDLKAAWQIHPRLSLGLVEKELGGFLHPSAMPIVFAFWTVTVLMRNV